MYMQLAGDASADLEGHFFALPDRIRARLDRERWP